MRSGATAAETLPLQPNSEVRKVYLEDATATVRIGFVRKVYGILSVQLILTIGIAAPICCLGPVWAAGNQWILWMSTGLLVATLCSMLCCQNLLKTYPANYILLFLLTVGMSVYVGFLSAMYTWQSVLLAAGITVAIFLALTAYACWTTQDFTGMGPYLAASLFCLIAFGFVLGIMAACGVNTQWGMILYDMLGVLIFTFYIIYDTQKVIGGDHQVKFTIDDYAFAALHLYLDIMNLFVLILSLLGDRR